MSRFSGVLVLAVLFGAPGGAVLAGEFGLGRAPLAGEIAAWDIDVRRDGTGLPKGSGAVASGEEIFLEKCAACHGEFGEGTKRWPSLVGGDDTLASGAPVKTVGSFWPYATTLYDYIFRTMPFGEAQSLRPDEVYGLVAFILNANGIIEDDAVLDETNLAAVKMPNRDGFIADTRPLHPAQRCMRKCKGTAVITSRAKPLMETIGRAR